MNLRKRLLLMFTVSFSLVFLHRQGSRDGGREFDKKGVKERLKRLYEKGQIRCPEKGQIDVCPGKGQIDICPEKGQIDIIAQLLLTQFFSFYTTTNPGVSFSVFCSGSPPVPKIYNMSQMLLFLTTHFQLSLCFVVRPKIIVLPNVGTMYQIAGGNTTVVKVIIAGGIPMPQVNILLLFTISSLVELSLLSLYGHYILDRICGF